MTVRYKVCCINSISEAWLAINHGAHALGLVSHMPSGPGVIEEEQIQRIADAVPPGISTFLLTSLQNTSQIINQQRRLHTNTLQLVDDLVEGSHEDLKEALPGIKIVQVLHVIGEETIEQAIQLDEDVDAILLDSGNPKLRVKELGGTGRTHDWSISAQIVEKISSPVFLAGGLGPYNIAAAIKEVKPFGIDLCSGLRENGNLVEERLKFFVDEIRQA